MVRLLVLALVAVALVAGMTAEEKGHKETLIRALDTIEGRIQATEESDAARADEIEANCTRDQATVANQIIAKKSDIENKKAQISQTKSKIQELEAELAVAQAARQQAQTEKDDAEQAIVDGDAERAQQNKEFLANTADTKVAIEAVADVQNIISKSKLEANQNDVAANFANKTLRSNNDQDYINAGVSRQLIEQSSTMLRSVAAKISDSTVRSFIEMAALSATSVDNVDKLNKLLAQLKEELISYEKQLADTEDRQVKDWATARAAWQATIVTLTQTIAEKDRLIDTLNASLDTQRGLLATYQADLQRLEGELADLQAQSAALKKMCDDEAAEYKARHDRRVTELATVAAIRRVVNEQLEATSTDAQVGTNYVGEKGYDWVRGDWGPCINRVRTMNLECRGPDGKLATETPHLKCGDEPAGIRKACRTETPKNDYFF